MATKYVSIDNNTNVVLTRVHKLINMQSSELFVEDPSAHNTSVHALVIQYRLPLTATLFSPCTSVKKRNADALLRAYVKHMIWYKEGQMY